MNPKREPEPDSSDDEPIAKKKKRTSDAAKGKTRESSASTERTPHPTARVESNDDGDAFFTIEKMRRVTVREFKGRTLVDIREHYADKATGQVKPGSKGISLTADQWAVLKANFALVDAMINEKK